MKITIREKLIVGMSLLLFTSLGMSAILAIKLISGKEYLFEPAMFFLFVAIFSFFSIPIINLILKE